MREKRQNEQASPIKRIRRWYRPSLTQSASVLLLWTQSKVPPFSRLCRNVTREIGSYLSMAVLLPGIYEDCLYVVNVRSRECHSVQLPEKGFNKALFAQVENWAAVCMRPTEAGYRAYWVDLTAMTLSELPGHILSSSIPKACYISGTVYVFRTIFGCEKYSLCAKKWTTLNTYIKHEILFALSGTHGVYIWQSCRQQDILQYFILSVEQLSKPINISPSLYMGQYGVCVRLHANRLIGLKDEYTLWMWRKGSNAVACKKPEKYYGGRPFTYGFGLLVGKELYWMDAYRPEVHTFHTERLERQWRKLTC